MANTLRFKRGLASGIPTAALGEPLFTTDTFDLYIGNGTGNTRFQKYIASGATTQILRGDGSLYTFPLAISSPSAGQVLKYNGTSWVNDSDSGITGSGSAGQVAYFTGATTQAGSNNLFWDATNNRLGILTNTPTTSFHINSGASTQGGAIFGKGSYNYATVSQLGSSGDALFGAGVIASATAGEVAKSVGDVGHYIKMQISDGITFHTNITGAAGTSMARSTNERARIFATGNFGINTGATDSGQRLQVNGTALISGNTTISLNQNAPTILNVSNTTNNTGALTYIRATSSAGSSEIGKFSASTTAYKIIAANNGYLLNSTVGDLAILNDVSGGSIKFAANGSSTTQMVLTSSGNLSLIVPTYNASVRYGFGNPARTDDAAYIQYIGVGDFTGHIAFGTNASTSNVAATEKMRLFANGNLVLNSTTDSGEKLQVTGTMKVTGASTIGGNLTVDTNTFFVDATNNRVGIGTTSVTGDFHIASATNVYQNISTSGNLASAVLCFYNSLANGDGAAIGYNVAMRFGTITGLNAAGFTERMRLDASGNLGLGVTPSAWGSQGIAFQMGKSTNLAGLVTEHFSTGNTSAGNSVNIGTGWIRNTSGTIVYSNSFTQPQLFGLYQGSYIWYNAAAGTAGNAITFTQAMTLDASGRLGIGTTSPTGKLHIIGNATDAALNLDSDLSGSYTVLQFRNAGTLKSQIYNNLSGGDLYITTTGASSLSFGTNNTERMRLHLNTGNLSIGSGADSGEKLQVTGTAKITGASSFGSTITIARGQDANVTNVNINSGVTPVSAFQLNTDQPNTRSILMARNGYSLVLGTQDANRVTLDTSGNLAVDTNTLFVDATNNRVGIGTTTPSDTLHVVGNILATGGGAFEIMNSSLANVTFVRATGGGTNVMSTASWGNNIAIGTETAHDLILASNNTERMRLSSNGFLQHTNATNPTASVVDSYLQYSADVTAGNAAPHFRTENGAVIKLYQETTSVGNSIISLGGGNAVLDDTTFDGYTLRQIVKALRNQGILQ